jgi:hypothetical protein
LFGVNDHVATLYSFESATALLAIRNTQNEDVEDKEEEEEREEAAGEQDISTKIRTHEQALHCISEVTHSKRHEHRKWKTVPLLDLWQKSQRVVCWKRVQCSVIEHQYVTFNNVLFLSLCSSELLVLICLKVLIVM